MQGQGIFVEGITEAKHLSERTEKALGDSSDPQHS